MALTLQNEAADPATEYPLASYVVYLTACLYVLAYSKLGHLGALFLIRHSLSHLLTLI
jgi:hypothetical protein